MTGARWLTPKDRLIDKNRLIPENVLELTGGDIKVNHYLQIEKTIKLLEDSYNVNLIP